MEAKFYTKIIHELRDLFEHTNNEYCVLDTIHRLSPLGWCNTPKDDLAKIIGVSRQGLYKIIKKLGTDLPEEVRLIHKDKRSNLKIDSLWVESYEEIKSNNIPNDDLLKGIETYLSHVNKVDSHVNKVYTKKDKKVSTKFTPDVNKVDSPRKQSLHSIYSNTNNINNTYTLFGESNSPNGKKSNGKEEWYGKTLDELFELFRKYYPDRGPRARNPKKRTYDYFKRLLIKEKEDPKIIILGAIAFKKAMADRKGEDRRTIPMASTWLNGNEYNDWYEEYRKIKMITYDEIKEQGYLTNEEAEGYSAEHFREPLSRTRNMFNIKKVNDQEYFKPL